MVTSDLFALLKWLSKKKKEKKADEEEDFLRKVGNLYDELQERGAPYELLGPNPHDLKMYIDKLDEILAIAEEAGAIKKRGDRIIVDEKLIYNTNPFALWAAKRIVGDRKELIIPAARLLHVTAAVTNKLPFSGEMENFPKPWEEYLEEVNNAVKEFLKFVEEKKIWTDIKEEAKEVIKILEAEEKAKEERMKELLPGWRAFLKTLEKDKMHVDEMKKIIKNMRAVEKIFDEVASHIEEKGEIDHLSFTAFLENLKREHDPHVVEAAAKDAIEEIVEKYGVDSLKALHRAKEMPSAVRRVLGEKLAEKLKKEEEKFNREELKGLRMELMEELQKHHAEMRKTLPTRRG